LAASFQFSSISDPSSADVAAGFNFRIDCTTDGVYDTAWSTTSTASCTYSDAGTFTVTGQVRDKDGGIGTATTSVTVLSVAQAMDAVGAMITALETSGALNHGQAAALLAKLEQARDMYAKGKNAQAILHLQILRQQVVTFGATGVLTPAETTQLLYWIDQLIVSVTANPGP
jgi:hypothetical protein